MFTIYIYKYIANIQQTKKYDKEEMKNWRRNSVWIRFVKSFFPFSRGKIVFFGCWHECSYAITGSGGTFLREKIAQKHLRMKKCSLLTTPSYNPKNSQSMLRGPIESNTCLTDQRLDRFLFEQKLWINIHRSGRAFSNSFLFSKVEKKCIFSDSK